MDNKQSAKLILDRSKESSNYTPYDDKRVYFDAIAAGNADEINELCTRNYEYPSKVFERSSSYTDAVESYRFEAVCAAAEMCLVAIQNAVPDMVAYDIRDRFIKEFSKAVSLPDLYYLIHGMAYDFAIRVRYAKTGGNYSPKTRKMMAFIESHLNERISLQDVADAAELSRTYASAVFREEVGVTMNEFIMKERINEARRMLKAGNFTIAEIAEKLQFCSQSYFSKCFREAEGMSPQKYRTNV